MNLFGIMNIILTSPELATIIAATGVAPSVHQMEMHPYLPQAAFVATHKALGIEITAYSPLGGYHPDLEFPPNLLKNEVVVDVARGSGCSVAQVVLKWGIMRGTSVIPKSSHEEHILDSEFDFLLLLSCWISRVEEMLLLDSACSSQLYHGRKCLATY